MKNRLRKKLSKFYDEYHSLDSRIGFGGLGGCKELGPREKILYDKKSRYWERIKRRGCHREYIRECWDRALKSWASTYIMD